MGFVIGIDLVSEIIVPGNIDSIFGRFDITTYSVNEFIGLPDSQANVIVLSNRSAPISNDVPVNQY